MSPTFFSSTLLSDLSRQGSSLLHPLGLSGSDSILLECADCAVTINTDKTVSRLHADIIVGPSLTVLPTEGAIPRPSIKIKDLSKFGTFINKQHESHPIKDLPDAEAPLKDGDIVTFGSTHCSFR